MSKNLPVKAHATLGASNASRWWACPGSVALTRDMPNASSEYAQEGTAAHALAELALKNGVSCHTYVGITLEGHEVTEEMADYVDIFVDYCQSRKSEKSQVFIEQQFSLAALNPPEPMFGTADCVVLDELTQQPRLVSLEVVDLKYGQGVAVDAFENKQLLYYALGVCLQFHSAPIHDVKVTIVQPRASHPDGIIRSFELDITDVMGFAQELMEHARATQVAGAALVAGSHCRFCPASGKCPAQLQAAQEVAMAEFSTVESHILPAPEALTDEQFAAVLSKAHIIDGWLSAVRRRAFDMLSRGESVPGQKLVAKRAMRRWVDPDETTGWLTAKGYSDDDIFVKKVKSPAQVEKLLKSKKEKLPEDLVVAESSGYNMVPESHPGTAVVLSAGADFPAIGAGEG